MCMFIIKFLRKYYERKSIMCALCIHVISSGDKISTTKLGVKLVTCNLFIALRGINFQLTNNFVSNCLKLWQINLQNRTKI